MVSTRTLIYAAIAVALSLFVLWVLCLLVITVLHDFCGVHSGTPVLLTSIPFWLISVFISRKFYLYIKSLLGFKFANEQ